MSEWNEFKPNRDDISFSDDGEEMHIHFESNYNGAVYLEIKVKDIKEALRSIKSKS